MHRKISEIGRTLFCRWIKLEVSSNNPLSWLTYRMNVSLGPCRIKRLKSLY